LLQDQFPGSLNVFRIAALDRLPGDDALDQFQQFLTLFGVVGARVVNESGEGGGAGGGQRSPRPPDVQGGRVAVADVLLSGRGFGDSGEGEVVFDEFSIHYSLTSSSGDRVGVLCVFATLTSQITDLRPPQ